MSFKYLYLPIGVQTFDLDAAKKEFDNSIKLLKSIDERIDYPSEMLLSIEKLINFIENKNVDLIIIQNVTFANGAYMSEILSRFNCDILLWTLKEPIIDGTRLRLNSLTGAFSGANVISNFKRPFHYVYGSINDKEVIDEIKSSIKASEIKKSLKELKIAQIGHTPQGFGFGRALDNEIKNNFGCNLISIEARELIDKAKAIDIKDLDKFKEDADKRIKGLNNITEKNVNDFLKLYKAYYDYIKENNIGALSSRCWPDFFTSYGTPVCAVLSILNDLGIPSSCEADTYGALSMFIGFKLSNSPVFFGDPVSLDEKENTITFWHCGTGACSLARKDKGAMAGVHCNRKIGPTLEFGVKESSNATIIRIGKNCDNKFRMFIAKGEVLDKPQQFKGTSAVFKCRSNAKSIIFDAINKGYEPHFVVVMDDVIKEVKILAKYLSIGIDIYE